MSSSPRLSIPAPIKKAPELVGPYVLGRTLGRGTTGKVKAAQHKDSGLEVAIKIVKKAYVKTHKQKIAREIAVMRLLDHPYVLKLYDVLETSQHIFIVLERVKGGELFDYILQKGRLPRQESLRIIAQIIQGLEFCHMHSICHRDLKPENLLLDENLNIKIADFGMAQLSPDGAALETFCGSPHYGAPEVVSGIRYDGKRSDVWSLGVVFYALVTGMLPFDNPNVSVLLKMVKRGVYHTPKLVPEDIADLIRRMLTVDVDQRIRTHELKYHRCFLGPNGTNMFFPPLPTPSPALEMMRSNPIVSRDDLDQNILHDLEGLGWGNAEQLAVKIMEKREDSNYNLETIFYQLLVARNKDRPESYKNGGGDFDEPESPLTPANLLPSPSSTPVPSSHATTVTSTPSSPSSTTGTRRASVSASPLATKVDLWKADAEKIEGFKEDVALETVEEKKVKMKKPLTISVVKNPAGEATNTIPQSGSATPPSMVNSVNCKGKEYSTTPRFHRLKVNGSQDDVSPNAPITPTAKRSWFKSLFRRRPSVDIASREHQTQGASGMYSEKSPSDLLKEVSRVLTAMGISIKIASDSDYELKCESTCYLDSKFRLVILGKNAEVVYKSDDQPEGNDTNEPMPDVKDRMNALAISNNSDSPKSPKTPEVTPQLIKFSVDISRESSDKVSCVNFNHRQGDVLVYRGLYTDLLRHIRL